jgi:hypothetical protein
MTEAALGSTYNFNIHDVSLIFFEIFHLKMIRTNYCLVVQAGGASTENSLSTALTSILDCLKYRDWTTRKAASSALSSIALSCDTYMLGSFTSGCLRSLEGCRFDKVSLSFTTLCLLQTFLSHELHLH